MAKLTATQEAFLKQLFGPCSGNLKTASKAVIGSEDYSQLMTDELLTAIKSRADSELILSVPKAVYIMQKLLDPEDGSFFASDKLHKIAGDILDRAGLSRQERPTHNSTTIGIVMLPNKALLPVPPKQLESVPILEGVDGVQTISAPEGN